MPAKKKNSKSNKRVTRYTFDDVKEPRTPETGHTALLPADEQVVTVPLDNGWSKALKTAKPLEGDGRWSYLFAQQLDFESALAKQVSLFSDLTAALRKTCTSGLE